MRPRHAHRAPRLASLAVAATVLALLGAPAGASAHAILESTAPQRGATLQEQPRQVVLRFSESVEANFGALRVFDAAAKRVDDGRTEHPGGSGSELAVGLKPGLPDGTYVATYRVISADSHPVSGGLVFSIGAPGAAATPTVGDLIGDTDAGPVTEIAFGVARGLTYLATALVIGGLGFLLAVWLPAVRSAAGAGEEWVAACAGFRGRARKLLLGGALLGVVAGAAGIVLQGATAGATTAWAALKPSVVGDVLGTRFGEVWSVRVLAFVVLGGATAWLLRGTRDATSPMSLRRVALGADGLAAPGPGWPVEPGAATGPSPAGPGRGRAGGRHGAIAVAHGAGARRDPRRLRRDRARARRSRERPAAGRAARPARRRARPGDERVDRRARAAPPRPARRHPPLGGARPHPPARGQPHPLLADRARLRHRAARHRHDPGDRAHRGVQPAAGHRLRPRGARQGRARSCCSSRPARSTAAASFRSSTRSSSPPRRPGPRAVCCGARCARRSRSWSSCSA